MRAEGIDKAEGKQEIIYRLYDNFFAKAFPRLRDKLGIVYTPTEVVDFIIHSVDHILKTEFGHSLGSDGVHIIDKWHEIEESTNNQYDDKAFFKKWRKISK